MVADVKQKEENLEESRRKLSAQVDSSKKDIEEMQSIYGQAHHMFSRFLNLSFFIVMNISLFCFFWEKKICYLATEKDTLQPSKKKLKINRFCEKKIVDS